MVRVLGQERDRAVKMPAKMVKELAEAQSQAISAWRKARDAKDYQLFRPALEKLILLPVKNHGVFGVWHTNNNE